LALSGAVTDGFAAGTTLQVIGPLEALSTGFAWDDARVDVIFVELAISVEWKDESSQPGTWLIQG